MHVGKWAIWPESVSRKGKERGVPKETRRDLEKGDSKRDSRKGLERGVQNGDSRRDSAREARKGIYGIISLQEKDIRECAGDVTR